MVGSGFCMLGGERDGDGDVGGDEVLGEEDVFWLGGCRRSRERERETEGRRGGIFVMCKFFFKNVEVLSKRSG